MAKVLIVDDDPDIREATSMVLEAAGFEVDCAGSRPDGMAAVEGFQPDLIILDVMMEQPDDGIAMAQDLRRNKYDGAILMLTSIGKVTGMDYGKDDSLVPVDDFQHKPIDLDTLVAKVHELLKKREG